MTRAEASAPEETTLLRTIGEPADLRKLSAAELCTLAGEIRAFLIGHVSGTGGHLGPNLGVVELTIAAHLVFDSPSDVLLFDTGHQAYVHKLLTGRGAGFEALRKAGGLSGYPCRAESTHDVIENSHASTALSYADGIANAFALRGEHHRRVVAVVGDGALTGGMSWEALNNLGVSERPVVVVLNDNGRSYAPTVGGIARHLAELRLADLSRTPERGTLFDKLGFAYLGPVDGHDIAELEHTMRVAVRLRRPVLVHCVTRKGNGYPPAERDEVDRMHAVGPMDPVTGCSRAPCAATWTHAFSDEITAIGAERDDVVCLTAAMPDACGLGGFAAKFPDRVFDVGLAEQHAVTSAAGLAIGGLHPVVAVYATFLGRAFDQLLLDVALHELPVTFVLDRAGITGPDGPSHHGMWDASILPVVPCLRLAAPRDCAQLRELLRESVDVRHGPTAIRYPKAAAGKDIPALRRLGHCDVLRADRGAPVLLVGVGALAGTCMAAADELAGQGVPVTVVDPRWITPLDPALVELAGAHRLVCAVEDTTGTGALGSRLGQAVHTTVLTAALPAGFLPHGSREQLLRDNGLDAAGIAATVRAGLAGSSQRPIPTRKERQW